MYIVKETIRMETLGRPIVKVSDRTRGIDLDRQDLRLQVSW